MHGWRRTGSKHQSTQCLARFVENMGCVRRLRFTSLVLFFYLVGLSDSNVCSTRTVVGVAENDSEQRRVDKVLQIFKSYQHQRSMRKILESAPKPIAKRNTEGSSDELPLEASAAATSQHTAAFNHLSSYDSFQKISESKGQPDGAVTEMHSMVHMDYHRSARRRPPINNRLPFKQGQPHVEP